MSESANTDSRRRRRRSRQLDPNAVSNALSSGNGSSSSPSSSSTSRKNSNTSQTDYSASASTAGGSLPGSTRTSGSASVAGGAGADSALQLPSVSEEPSSGRRRSSSSTVGIFSKASASSFAPRYGPGLATSGGGSSGARPAPSGSQGRSMSGSGQTRTNSGRSRGMSFSPPRRLRSGSTGDSATASPVAKSPALFFTSSQSATPAATSLAKSPPRRAVSPSNTVSGQSVTVVGAQSLLHDTDGGGGGGSGGGDTASLTQSSGAASVAASGSGASPGARSLQRTLRSRDLASDPSSPANASQVSAASSAASSSSPYHSSGSGRNRSSTLPPALDSDGGAPGDAGPGSAAGGGEKRPRGPHPTSLPPHGSSGTTSFGGTLRKWWSKTRGGATERSDTGDSFSSHIHARGHSADGSTGAAAAAAAAAVGGSESGLDAAAAGAGAGADDDSGYHTFETYTALKPVLCGMPGCHKIVTWRAVRCPRCAAVFHSECSEQPASRKMACRAVLLDSGRLSPQSVAAVAGSTGGARAGGARAKSNLARRSRVTTPLDEAAEHELFLALVTASDVAGLATHFTDSRLRLLLARPAAQDQKMPLVVAAERYGVQPSASVLACFGHLLMHAPAQTLNMVGPDGQSLLTWVFSLCFEETGVLDALLDAPGLLVPSGALASFCSKFRRVNFQPYVEKLRARGAALHGTAGRLHNTALHYACNNITIGGLLVRYLVGQGAPVNVPNQRGETPLFNAIQVNQTDIVRFLLDEAGAQVEWVNAEHMRPIDICDARTDPALTRLLQSYMHDDETDDDDDTTSSSSSSADDDDDDDVEDTSDFTGDPSNAATLATVDGEISSSLPSVEEDGDERSLRTHHSGRSSRRSDMASLRSHSSRLSRTQFGELEEDVTARLQESSIIASKRKVDLVLEYGRLAFFEELGRGTYGSVFRGTLRLRDDHPSAIRQEAERLRLAGAGNPAAKQELMASGRTPAAKLAQAAATGQTEVTMSVAIKFLAKQPPAEFVEQVEIWSAMDHPNVTYLYGVCLSPQLFMVMEIGERGSLLSVLNKPNLRITWPRLLLWTRQVAFGMAYLHAHDPPIFHRDCKPANILVTSDWRLKLADFDTARFVNREDGGLTGLAAIAGTPSYMPPEILNGDPFVASGDVYSLGVTLNEISTRVIDGVRQDPFADIEQARSHPGPYGVMMYVAGEACGRPTMPKRAPLPWRQLISDCWQRDAPERPTAAQVCDRVKELSHQYQRSAAMFDSACAAYSHSKSSTSSLSTLVVSRNRSGSSGSGGSSVQLVQAESVPSMRSRSGSGSSSRSKRQSRSMVELLDEEVWI